jgi:signal peptidase
MDASTTAENTPEASDADTAGKHRHVPLWQRTAGWTVRGLLIAVCVTAALLTILPAAFGYQRYSIQSSAMGSTIAKGSVVYDRVVPTSNLRVGDVITYQPPAGVIAPGDRVTERIVSMTRGLNGRTVYQTKGDANATADPWKFSLSGTSQAEVAIHIPFVGYPLNWLATRGVRIGLIVGIAVLIVLRLAVGLWADASLKEKRRTRAELRDAAEAANAGSQLEAPAEEQQLAAEFVEAEADEGGLDSSRAAALAALIAASSAVASARGLIGVQETVDDATAEQSRTRAAS